MMETTSRGFQKHGVAKDPEAEPGLVKKEDFSSTALCALGLGQWRSGSPFIGLISVLCLLPPLWALQMLYFLREAKLLQGKMCCFQGSCNRA